MRLRQRAGRSGTGPRPLIGERVDLTSATDRRTHYVTDTAYGHALAARTGRCPAVCGHDVILCALVTPPGPLCRRCSAAR